MLCSKKPTVGILLGLFLFVTLFAAGLSAQTLSVSPSTLFFAYQTGQATPPQQSVQVTGSAALNTTVTTNTGGSGDTGGTGTVGGSSAGGTATGGTSAGPTCPKPAGQICHEFVANDNGKNQVNYVNEFTGMKWTTPVGSTGANSPRTIEVVDNAKAAGGKALLVSVNTGYVEIDLSNGTKLLEVKAQSTTSVA